MSAEAARIINTISSRQANALSKKQTLLGTIKSPSPLTLQLDGIGFDITRSLFKTETLSKTQLQAGDRVLTICVDNACYIILDKVVKA